MHGGLGATIAPDATESVIPRCEDPVLVIGTLVSPPAVVARWPRWRTDRSAPSRHKDQVVCAALALQLDGGVFPRGCLPQLAPAGVANDYGPQCLSMTSF